MKRIILAIILIFIGCNEKKEKKTAPVVKKEKNITINIDDLTLIFHNNKLIYPKKRVILLFDTTLKQADVLDDLNITYYYTQNKFLKNYFNIRFDPTIIILDKNKTIKYENFVPYEILKEEGL